MRPAFIVALLTALGGLTYYKLGTPSVHAYPSPDGTMVVKLTLSRAPWFVAYFRASGSRKLGSGSRSSA
ncbi:MAG: hypothetical protein M3281_07810 [Chloroflexota bacterium]|nr:hypothetical protein [Chloroflexota bacterium]